LGVSLKLLKAVKRNSQSSFSIYDQILTSYKNLKKLIIKENEEEHEFAKNKRVALTRRIPGIQWKVLPMKLHTFCLGCFLALVVPLAPTVSAAPQVCTDKKPPSCYEKVGKIKNTKCLKTGQKWVLKEKKTEPGCQKPAPEPDTRLLDPLIEDSPTPKKNN